MIPTQIINDAIAHYGAQHQMIVVIEELAELQKEITKTFRGKLDRKHLIEELADVKIVQEYIPILFDITDDELDAEITKKLERLEGTIEDERKRYKEIKETI